MTKKKKTILIVVVVIVAVLAAGVAFGAYYINSKLSKVQTVELSEDEVEVNELPEETTEVEEDNYTTIAIFGLDNRNLSTLDKGLSDVIMIVSIDNTTKEMQMVSVYRDTYLNTDPNGKDTFQKANAAYSYGGPERAISMLNTNLDLNIDNYVTVNFKTVADAIDVLGGVDIDIESSSELEWLNFYIDHTNGIMGTSAPSVSGLGVHTLSGVQAVAYGRIRYTSGGDYSRAERHRTVLTQVFKKAKTADLATIDELLDVVCPEIKTDLSTSQILSMLTQVLTYDLSGSRGFPFEKTTTMHASAGSIVVPCDLETNVRELHIFLYGNEDYEPTDTVKSYSQTIINNTGLTASSAVADDYEGVDEFGDEAGGVNAGSGGASPDDMYGSGNVQDDYVEGDAVYVEETPAETYVQEETAPAETYVPEETAPVEETPVEETPTEE